MMDENGVRERVRPESRFSREEEVEANVSMKNE